MIKPRRGGGVGGDMLHVDHEFTVSSSLLTLIAGARLQVLTENMLTAGKKIPSPCKMLGSKVRGRSGTVLFKGTSVFLLLLSFLHG